MNVAVEAAVIENGAETILRDGLAYDRCQVGIVTDMEGAQQLAEFDIAAADQLTKVLRTQVDVVLQDGVAVLNAADALVAAPATLCDGEVILYADNPELAAITAHRAGGGRAVFVRSGHVILASAAAENTLASLDRLMRQNGHATSSSRQTLRPCILAAVAAAWALNISPDLIAVGIETFQADLQPYYGAPELSAAT